MKEFNKPIPKTTPWSSPFWDGCRRHELLIQRCKNCNKLIFYPKLFCPYCLGTELEWVRSSGRGRVYTYAIIHSYCPTEFMEDIPYIVAVIELEEGVRMMSNIIGCPLDKIKCDMEVEVVFDAVNEEITLPKFKPVVLRGEIYKTG